MRKQIYATTGRSTSKDYIKVALFDYLVDLGLDIDGYPAEQIVNRVAALAPIYDVDDVLNHMDGAMITFTEALADCEEEASNM